MRLRGRVNTAQIEDRRGRGRGLAVGGGGLGAAGIVVVLLVTLLGGGGAGDVLRQLETPTSGGTRDAAPLSCPDGADTNTACFVTGVVNDVQATWADIFRRQGRSYEVTKLVLFTDATSSGCGHATSATGPFYCPADSKVYLDLGFFQELRDRFGAPGDFAQAYVVAHEFGHHVQNLLGRSARGNAQSVRLELQADCYAGVWAHETTADLDASDFDEALTAAASVGDDRLQREAGVRVNPDSWTHGSSAQRQTWFRQGAASGDPADCDTFSSTP